LADFQQSISLFGHNGSTHPAPQELEGMKMVAEILGGKEPALKDALDILHRQNGTTASGRRALE